MSIFFSLLLPNNEIDSNHILRIILNIRTCTFFSILKFISSLSYHIPSKVGMNIFHPNTRSVVDQTSIFTAPSIFYFICLSISQCISLSFFLSTSPPRFKNKAPYFLPYCIRGRLLDAYRFLHPSQDPQGGFTWSGHPVGKYGHHPY